MPQTREVRARHAVCSILITAFDCGQRLQPEYHFRMVVIAEVTLTTSGTISDILTIYGELAAMSMSSVVRCRGRKPIVAVLNGLEFCGSSDLSEMDSTATDREPRAIVLATRCRRLASKVH